MATPVIALVVDDEALVRRIEDALSGRGYGTVRWRADGAVTDETVDAAIVDVGGDGASGGRTRFLEGLRADPRTAELPVTCLVGRDALEVQHRLRERFGVDIVAVPFEPEELALKVREMLKPRPGELMPTRPQPPGEGGGEQPTTLAPEPAGDVVVEASEESFPASDAPGWASGGIGGRSEEPKE